MRACVRTTEEQIKVMVRCKTYAQIQCGLDKCIYAWEWTIFKSCWLIFGFHYFLLGTFSYLEVDTLVLVLVCQLVISSAVVWLCNSYTYIFCWIRAKEDTKKNLFYQVFLVKKGVKWRERERGYENRKTFSLCWSLNSL